MCARSTAPYWMYPAPLTPAHGRESTSIGTDWPGTPQIQLIALAHYTTPTLIDTVFGPVHSREYVPATRLTRSLHAEMLVLLDAGRRRRGLPDRGGLHRCRIHGPPAPHRPSGRPERYPDGSWLTVRAGLEGRAIAVTVVVAPRKAPAPPPGCSPPPCATGVPTPPATWSRATTTAGKSRRGSARSSRRCSTAGSCAAATGPTWHRKSMPC
jgi:hypothetical protein